MLLNVKRVQVKLSKQTLASVIILQDFQYAEYLESFETDHLIFHKLERCDFCKSYILCFCTLQNKNWPYSLKFGRVIHFFEIPSSETNIPINSFFFTWYIVSGDWLLCNNLCCPEVVSLVSYILPHYSCLEYSVKLLFLLSVSVFIIVCNPGKVAYISTE